VASSGPAATCCASAIACCQRLAGLGQAVDHAELVHALAAHAFAGQAQLGQDLARDEFGQQRRGAAVGREAHLDVGHRELRVLRGHQHVAGQRQRQAGARGRALHRHDHGLGAVAQRAHQVVQAFEPEAALGKGQLAPLDDLAQVAARAEMPALAGDHHGAYGGVARGRVQRRREAVVEARRERVARAGVVVGQHEHGAFAAGQQGVVGHGHLLYYFSDSWQRLPGKG